MPPHFVQGAGIGTGAAVVVTVRHVEQSQLRLCMRSSGPTISSGGPRCSITSRSFMAQDVADSSAERHQPSRLPRCGKARKLEQMSEAPTPPTAERRPAWRAAALAYRQARRDGVGHDAAMSAAEASLREQWPELSAKEASAEVVAAIAYASSHHAAWLWDGVGSLAPDLP
jgi:hypothetical protein